MSRDVPGASARKPLSGVGSRGAIGLEKRIRICGDVLVQEGLVPRVEDAEEHGSGVEVEAAVGSVLCLSRASWRCSGRMCPIRTHSSLQPAVVAGASEAMMSILALRRTPAAVALRGHFQLILGGRVR